MKIVLLVVVAVVVLVALSALRKPKARDASELPAPDGAVAALITAGNKVGAIRAYWKQTGASLLEAKRVIDGHAP